ncbi:MAG TPA: asparagine synthase (glutamine-hydrolyzing) [Leptospiraceae bacterium]|nr:asparagine synthase (glutamine-hydrolyzing) [Leptospiraceae bacterium]HMX31629.1 asparagine synthase (glutamine-hydrolyzing) [Leptospiraceae bacterium]HMY30486.1 asparagine synthase (glutamine-hydrolyzing) [Leptospiraceae bacterium]HMZ65579.1 asparagine synthase (glutamine-hydrolyzing) [Leptospiraceae bacterium]HNA06492.1 asparagine synthase (glutamine-hydrolyzing) [Leptospiraceae bacterium]
MCGIVGFFSNNLTKENQIINSMLTSIQHRGPDGHGVFDVDNIVLGHVRLAIIDIQNGIQPFITADNRYVLIFNGEIYNYLELRQTLVSKGYKLTTYSDTEVLLYMFVEYGKKCLDYLNGMFAFAIYDRQSKELFLARDHFGIKPLYYYAKNGKFAFASEIKALLKHPEIQADLDENSLYEYLTFQMVLDKNTLFKDIYKLNPASYMIVKDSKILEEKVYWNLDYTIDESKTIDQFSDELLILLDSSLSIQMRSDVPVGAYLSGGLDSSIVSVLAAKNYLGEFKTFTGGFRESSDYDETYYAKVVSNKIKSQHFEIFPDHNDFLNVYEKLIYHMDEPAAGPGLFPQYIVSKLASENVKVVLGGQGGDELFGGYARYSVAYLEQCIKGAIFDSQEEGNHIVTLQSIIPNMPLLKQYVPMMKTQFSEGLFDEMDKRYFRLVDRSPSLNKIYSSDFLNQINKEKIFEKFQSIFNFPQTKSYFNKMTHFDTKTLLPSLLQVEDRVSMAVSIESRVPLLDKRIAELSAKMPPTMKFSGGKTKYMLLNAAKNILPTEIVNRKDKMGFPTPTNEWFNGPLKNYVLDHLLGSNSKTKQYFNSANLEKVLKGTEKFSRDVWGALSLEIWFKTFL